MNRAGPLNQRFSNCTVSRTHLASGDFVSRSGVETTITRVPNSLPSQLTLLVHRPRLEQQSSGAGRAEISCKGPGSTFPGFGGLMVYAQKNIYFCSIDYAKAFDCVDHNKLWKILQEMGIPDHLTYLLSNLYAGQEATVRT